jgi:hypothetical protein
MNKIGQVSLYLVKYIILKSLLRLEQQTFISERRKRKSSEKKKRKKKRATIRRTTLLIKVRTKTKPKAKLKAKTRAKTKNQSGGESRAMGQINILTPMGKKQIQKMEKIKQRASIRS